MAKNSCGHDDCFTCPYPDCINNGWESNLRWRKKNSNYHREYSKKYYAEHREEILAKEKAKKKDRSEYFKKYYQEHKEKMIQNALDRYYSTRDKGKFNAESM